MVWLNSFGKFEYSAVGIFILFYGIYFIKLYFLNKKLKITWGRIILKFVLRSAYFSIFLIALMGPTFGDIKKEIKSIGKDIFFVVDLSASMNAADLQPSRMEKTKYEIGNITKQLESDRLALVIFGDKAYMHCPLTYDKQAFETYLKTLHTSLIPETGTQLQAPLQLILQKLPQLDKETSKLIVLFTDGEHYDALDIQKYKSALQQNHITLIIVGVGTEKGSMIMEKTGPKKDLNGSVIQTKINKPFLKKLSKEADGYYFEISDEVNETQGIIKRILKTEGNLNAKRKIDSAANKYYYFLILGIILLIADIVVVVKTTY